MRFSSKTLEPQFFTARSHLVFSFTSQNQSLKFLICVEVGFQRSLFFKLFFTLKKLEFISVPWLTSRWRLKELQICVCVNFDSQIFLFHLLTKLKLSPSSVVKFFIVFCCFWSDWLPPLLVPPVRWCHQSSLDLVSDWWGFLSPFSLNEFLHLNLAAHYFLCQVVSVFMVGRDL